MTLLASRGRLKCGELRVSHAEAWKLPLVRQKGGREGSMTKSKGWKATIIGLVLASAAVTTACGTVGGAAVGAGSGAAIGAGTGYGAGKGALIGTGVGAAAGAVYDIMKKQ